MGMLNFAMEFNMFEIDFNNPINIHFIGIGGISMSGLAEVVLSRGFHVTGSDNKESDLTRSLEKAGAVISIGQRAENIPENCKLVVYTAAIHQDNPEFAEALKRGIPMLTRASMLGQLMKNFPTAIAVSGTHGKTTTTSMISLILLKADLDPTISVGGILPAIGGNFRVGGTKVFVTEACEYTDSFLSFYPTLNLILNVEADHLDYFGNLENVRKSFKSFANLLPNDGALVINADIENYNYFTKDLKCPFLTYSIDNKADVTASDITYNELARASFTCVYKGNKFGHFSLNVPGRHNVENALAAIACGISLGLTYETIKSGLESFYGTDRRFQIIGKTKNDVIIIDDYAHHPTEIKACLSTAIHYPHKKLWCVFQPHTYTRTAAFLDDFAGALSLADEVILSDIYAAREVNTVGVSSEDMVKRINELGTKSFYIPDFDSIADYIKDKLAPGDVLITMGAGEAYKVGKILLEDSNDKN